MGCGDSSVQHQNQSASNRNHQSRKPLKNDDSIFSAKTINDDESLLSKMPNPNENLHIQPADSQAFNNSLIQQRQQAIDNQQYRATINSWKPSSLRQLVDLIGSFGKDKSMIDRHWIIYYWIVTNIQYDTVGYFSGKYGDQSAEGVFRSKRGVCAGYGNLYKFICDQINLSCQIISGYSKGYGFENRVDAPSKTDHAWNAVEIDRHWYIVESTWGAGYLNEEKGFVQALESYYFLPRPEEIIYHHLPQDEKWQLLSKPITMKEFMTIANLRPIFFKYHLELIHPRYQTHLSLLPGKSYSLVKVRVPNDVYLMADVAYQNRRYDSSHFIQFDKQKKIYRCYFAAIGVGKHKISVYAKQGGTDTGTYQDALDFVMEVPKVPSDIVTFPRVWKNFFDLGIEILSPSNTNTVSLKGGAQIAEIILRAPKDVVLLGRLKNSNGKEVKYGQQIFYDRPGQIWVCLFAPDQDGLFEAEIMAKNKSDPGQYTSAVNFKINGKQISSPPVSFPETWSLFYDLGLEIEAPHDRAYAVWPDNGSYAEVLIRAPDNVELTARIEHRNQEVMNGTLVQYISEKKLWQLLFAPEQSGEHELTVFAKDSHDTKASSHSAVKFSLNVTKLKRAIKFPMIYTQFQTKKCQIIAPIEGTLKRNSVLPFHLILPGASDVLVQVDSESLPSGGLSKSVWKENIRVGSKDVVVYGKFDKKSDYDGLLRYEVQ